MTHTYYLKTKACLNWTNDKIPQRVGYQAPENIFRVTQIQTTYLTCTVQWTVSSDKTEQEGDTL